MNFDFGKLFPATGKPPVRIRASRPMHLSPLDGPSRHVDRGEEVIISAATFGQLEPGDYEMIDSGKPAVEVTDPTPARQDPRPLPARWDELPKCFSDYWTITEEVRCAREHVSEIIAARTEFFGSINFSIGDMHGKALVGGVVAVNSRGTGDHGLISTVRPIDFDDPQLRKVDRLLTIAEDAARDHYNRLLDQKEIALQRAFLACGQHRLAIADELRELLDELSQIGFQLFTVRTQALGLGEWQTRRLYHGSADFARFSDHAPAIGHGVSSAGLDGSGQVIPYSDLPVQSQAHWSLQMAERLGELKLLLAEGRKELAKARKASQAAAA